MEFKGTKGEWLVFCKEGNLETQISTRTHRIADVKHFDQQIDDVLLEPTIEEGKANAKLISCAPEMLEMLNSLTKRLYNEFHYVPLSMIDEIQQLIKKATEL